MLLVNAVMASWNDLNIKIIGGYHDLCLNSDDFLLVDISEEFMKA